MQDAESLLNSSADQQLSGELHEAFFLAQQALHDHDPPTWRRTPARYGHGGRHEPLAAARPAPGTTAATDADGSPRRRPRPQPPQSPSPERHDLSLFRHSQSLIPEAYLDLFSPLDTPVPATPPAPAAPPQPRSRSPRRRRRSTRDDPRAGGIILSVEPAVPWPPRTPVAAAAGAAHAIPPPAVVSARVPDATPRSLGAGAGAGAASRPASHPNEPLEGLKATMRQLQTQIQSITAHPGAVPPLRPFHPLASRHPADLATAAEPPDPIDFTTASTRIAHDVTDFQVELDRLQDNIRRHAQAAEQRERDQAERVQRERERERNREDREGREDREAREAREARERPSALHRSQPRAPSPPRLTPADMAIEAQIARATEAVLQRWLAPRIDQIERRLRALEQRSEAAAPAPSSDVEPPRALTEHFDPAAFERRLHRKLLQDVKAIFTEPQWMAPPRATSPRDTGRAPAGARSTRSHEAGFRRSCCARPTATSASGGCRCAAQPADAPSRPRSPLRSGATGAAGRDPVLPGALLGDPGHDDETSVLMKFHRKMDRLIANLSPAAPAPAPAEAARARPAARQPGPHGSMRRPPSAPLTRAAAPTTQRATLAQATYTRPTRASAQRQAVPSK
ncbi:hypothetical protein CXG81DRAFT_19394 [Caulochytrium protostelioides]|uniref:Uncharacterized protein n=1 Tax=Caulochytrium protostelioides TaxID=1555241 RepID=A0A4V1IUI8_9FUNG|nr:hypothetical protein CXG81DRAFT_19394 [Caulochytrium protostelioides]|eukprot:RKP00709.1 hypothetical protein CXG81DRAFT_19394 [Caulochytrium protostelioides]